MLVRIKQCRYFGSQVVHFRECKPPSLLFLFWEHLFFVVVVVVKLIRRRPEEWWEEKWPEPGRACKRCHGADILQIIKSS